MTQQTLTTRISALAAALLSALFLGLSAWGPVQAADTRYYDSQGRYQGRVDDNGRRYDAQGRYQGRVDKNGRYYDAQGRYQGRVDDNGRFYDSQGRYQGRAQ